MNPKNLAIGLLATVLLAAAGCSGQKNAATQAVNSIEASLASVSAEASKYLPGELESVESSVTALKESLSQGDYKSVVANAPGVTSSIQSLQSAVAAKADEAKAAMAEWGDYATAVPQMVTALQSRVDVLAKSKKMPKGLDATAFGNVQSDLESMKTDWAAASTASESGNAIDALAKAKSAKATGDKLLQQLGMSSG